MNPVETAVRRVLASLSPAEQAAVATGRARVEVQPVAQPDPAQLDLYLLTPARGIRRPVPTPVPERDHGAAVDVPALDIRAVAARIDTLPTPASVEAYLQDPRFTVPVLKQIARALGPTVLCTGRSKAALQRDIVAGTAGYRSRSAAMSGGAWS